MMLLVDLLAFLVGSVIGFAGVTLALRKYLR